MRAHVSYERGRENKKIAGLKKCARVTPELDLTADSNLPVCLEGADAGQVDITLRARFVRG